MTRNKWQGQNGKEDMARKTWQGRHGEGKQGKEDILRKTSQGRHARKTWHGIQTSKTW